MIPNRTPSNVFLSHHIGRNTPMYGNDGNFTRQKLKRISDGDTSNSERWCLNNHTGTHVDFPRHFWTSGKTLADYTADDFVATKVSFLELSGICRPGFVFEPTHFEKCPISKDTEVLLLKTGFEACRGEDVYWQQNPGFSDKLADHFRERCPDIRFFGFDSISLTSFQNRSLGRAAHRAFLRADNPILPIEDMRLSALTGNVDITRLIIAPLQVEAADGTPVTVIAMLAQ